MKTFNKILLGMAAVTTVLAPLVPKNFNVNINLEPPSRARSYVFTEVDCDLSYKTITDTGVQVCEYQCRDKGKTRVFKTLNTTAMCSTTVVESTKQYQ
jgi:hypothetical protein